MEIWKSVEQNKNYEISNFGNIRSLDRISVWRGVPKLFKGKLLKLCQNGHGYHQVILYNNKNKKSAKIHRLVAQAFCDGDKSLDVDHINHNRQDNRAENLRFVTDSQNSRNRKNVKGYTKLTNKYKNTPYHAKTKLNKKQISLGFFATPEEATFAHKCFLIANQHVQ
jgi:hypothetical protein